MRFTNVHGLPDTIIRASHVRNAMYQSNADRSVTQLINPPQIDVLRKVHFREMEKDISEEFFGLFGSAIHKILEWGADADSVEERLYANVNGWIVSGQIDLQKHKDGWAIIDYKFCSAYSLTKDDGGKPEWERQLNLYAYLMWINKRIRVTDINVCAIVRDWQRRSAQADLTYPQSIITMVPLKLWTIDEQEAYIRDRVAAHQQAQFSYDMEGVLPECSHEDRWAAADKWSVVKVGKKRAKNFASEEAAKKYGEEVDGEVEIEHRPGKSVRCGYCMVSQWCHQFQRMKEVEYGPGPEEGDRSDQGSPED